MQSPFTGGHATLRHELSELTFRKEKFQYVHQFYECDETKERFTTTALDEVIRQRYGLPASKMSQILGFGDNQYRLYENGDMPSEANGKILMSIQNPQIFESFVVNARNQFEEEEFIKILHKVKAINTNANDAFIKDYIFNGSRRDIFNGYATQSISKLLFYTDFYSYKMTSKGMSGLAYKAIQRGPVPIRWDRIYSFYDDIQQEIVHFESGAEGTRLTSTLSPDLSEFSDEELEILETIYQRFKADNSTKISDISHNEDAWQKYVDSGQMINFDMAFTLKAI